jgi:RNA polymerase sigma-70 factor (ECF subfamily)
MAGGSNRPPAASAEQKHGRRRKKPPVALNRISGNKTTGRPVAHDQSQATDPELIRRAAEGDHAAFHTLVDRHAQGLFRLAYAMVGSAADAEDVVQEALAGAYRNVRSFQGRSSVKTWLSRILMRQAAGSLRSRRTRRARMTQSIDQQPAADRSNDPAMGVESSAEGVNRRIDIAAALQKLSREHREVVVLREFEGLSYEEIAEVLDVPRGTVDSRLSRARRELQRGLKDYAADFGAAGDSRIKKGGSADAGPQRA